MDLIPNVTACDGWVAYHRLQVAACGQGFLAAPP
jgi:hypothetical protein